MCTMHHLRHTIAYSQLVQLGSVEQTNDTNFDTSVCGLACTETDWVMSKYRIFPVLTN